MNLWCVFLKIRGSWHNWTQNPINSNRKYAKAGVFTFLINVFPTSSLYFATILITEAKYENDMIDKLCSLEFWLIDSIHLPFNRKRNLKMWYYLWKCKFLYEFSTSFLYTGFQDGYSQPLSLGHKIFREYYLRGLHMRQGPLGQEK